MSGNISNKQKIINNMSLQ